MDRRNPIKLSRIGILTLSLCVLRITAARPLEPGKLGNVDVFGVAPGSVAELERCFGVAAREYVAAASTPGQGAHARELEAKLEQRIKEAGGFAAVEVTAVHYSQPNVPSNLTFNITVAGKKPVEYLPEPMDDVLDPDGLLASWREYETIGSALDYAGQIAESPPCPAHHCLYGFDHPKLRAYGEKFAQKVPADRAELIKVLKTDKDAKKRASAAYLLAHLQDARDVLETLLPQLRDPSPNVRNSVMRVVALMAEHGEARSISPEPVLPFLASPVLTDRNKAVSIVAALAGDKRNRKLLIQRSGCNLVRLTELKQTNQTEFAHDALVNLRGADLKPSSPAAWRRWLKAQGVTCRAEPEIGPGKLCPLKPPAALPASQ
ncbi:MAG: HEAT repeat domain-containing protein [Thermoanaerobaculia bacterium]